MNSEYFLLGKKSDFNIVAIQVSNDEYLLEDKVSGQQLRCLYDEDFDVWRSLGDKETIKDDNGDDLEVHKEITNPQLLTLLNQQRTHDLQDCGHYDDDDDYDDDYDDDDIDDDDFRY